LEAYPNPVTNGEITFTYSSTNEAKTITVFNVNGQEVARFSLPQWSSVQRLKLPKLASGVYMARLSVPNSQLATASVKFVVE
jgi:hypothetical protein